MVAGLCYATLFVKAVDKWVLGDAEAPPNVWHSYLNDIANSHNTQLLIPCNVRSKS